MHTLLRSQVNLLLAIATIVLGTLAGGVAGTILARDAMHDFVLESGPGVGQAVELQYGVWPELANTDFFGRVRDGLIADRASFLEANLSRMTLTVYTDGVSTLTVPIKSKGKEGSWWETPSGLYRAQGKTEKHYSSFGHVYMPWSIPFQGNFFIHGWPYYPDGTPVAEGYSGGCIRLEDSYAEQVYRATEVGMPILVFEEQPITAFTYALEAPAVSAASYLVADLETNFVLMSGHTRDVRTTDIVVNIMTALVASEHQNIEKLVTIDDRAERGSSTRLVPGASYSLYDLFFPLLLEDSSDARDALAEYFGSRRFTSLLNTKASALGMESTSFGDLSTYPGAHTTTAEDVFLLLKHVRMNRPFILSMSAGTTDTRTYGAPQFTDIQAIHPFFGEAEFLGGSAQVEGAGGGAGNDTTAAVMLAFASSTTRAESARGDLVTILGLPFGNETRPVAFILLGSSDPGQDTRTMIEYIERMYH